MNRISLLLTLALASGCDILPPPCLGYLGDGLPGNRAKNGCSDGLVLRSLSLEAVPYITALGGTQTFSMESPDGESYDSPVLVDVLDSMEVTDISLGQFTIRALGETGPKGAIVTVREASGGKLLDTFRLVIKPVDDVLLSPFKVGGFLAFGAHAAFVGSNIELKSTVNSPDDIPSPVQIFVVREVMADESLQFNPAEDSSLFTVEQQTWDRGILRIGNTPSSTTLFLHTGAGDRYEYPIVVVDSIEFIDILYSGPLSNDIGRDEYRWCALPFHAEEGHVKGVPLIFETTGPAEFVRADDLYACINLTFTGTGPVELTVTGAGVSATSVIMAGEE